MSTFKINLELIIDVPRLCGVLRAASKFANPSDEKLLEEFAKANHLNPHGPTSKKIHRGSVSMQGKFDIFSKLITFSLGDRINLLLPYAKEVRLTIGDVVTRIDQRIPVGIHVPDERFPADVDEDPLFVSKEARQLRAEILPGSNDNIGLSRYKIEMIDRAPHQKTLCDFNGFFLQILHGVSMVDQPYGRVPV